MRRCRTGLPGGGRSAPPRGPDPEAIRRIPEITGPEAYTTADAGELSEIYDDLGSRIGTRAEEREITVAFAGGAVLLLRLAIGASCGVRAHRLSDATSCDRCRWRQRDRHRPCRGRLSRTDPSIAMLDA